MKKIIMRHCAILIILLFANICTAQEINSIVIVNGSSIQGVDQKIFKTLEQGLTEFINTRHWGNDEFAPGEKIEANFNLTFVKKNTESENNYTCKLSIQASRPVYGTNYKTPIINYLDKDVTIRYVEFQPLDFNDNRITTNDPLASNLTALFAYYVYYIMALDYDSYAPKGGTPYYNKALNIINNAPEGSGISGWKREGNKNRYWLVDNMLNSRFGEFRNLFYSYHREGLDAMTEKPKEADELIKTIIPKLAQINSENPTSSVMSMYFGAKSQEYFNLLSASSNEEKMTLVPIISTVDVTNAVKYSGLLK
jgi:Domain of unknown function (DUF4835)